MVFFHRLFLSCDLHAAKKIVNLIIPFLEDAPTIFSKLVHRESQLVQSPLPNIELLSMLKLTKLLGPQWS